MSAASRWSFAAQGDARVTRGGWLCAVVVVSVGCRPGAAAEPVLLQHSAPTLEAFRSGLQELEQLRAAASIPRTLRISVRSSSRKTPAELTARGAVALAPPDRLRMILLGPGGTTALDLWIGEDRFRFSVPAVDLVRRGSVVGSSSQEQGLPVSFLRSWLLCPGCGKLLWLGRTPEASRFILRDRDAIVDLRIHRDGHLSVRRTTRSTAEPARVIEEETLEAHGIGCAAAEYSQKSTGVSLHIDCEGETRGPPLTRALSDPDQEQTP